MSSSKAKPDKRAGRRSAATRGGARRTGPGRSQPASNKASRLSAAQAVHPSPSLDRGTQGLSELNESDSQDVSDDSRNSFAAVAAAAAADPYIPRTETPASASSANHSSTSVISGASSSAGPWNQQPSSTTANPNRPQPLPPAAQLQQHHHHHHHQQQQQQKIKQKAPQKVTASSTSTMTDTANRTQSSQSGQPQSSMQEAARPNAAASLDQAQGVTQGVASRTEYIVPQLQHAPQQISPHHPDAAYQDYMPPLPHGHPMNPEMNPYYLRSPILPGNQWMQHPVPYGFPPHMPYRDHNGRPYAPPPYHGADSGQVPHPYPYPPPPRVVSHEQQQQQQQQHQQNLMQPPSTMYVYPPSDKTQGGPATSSSSSSSLSSSSSSSPSSSAPPVPPSYVQQQQASGPLPSPTHLDSQQVPAHFMHPIHSPSHGSPSPYSGAMAPPPNVPHFASQHHPHYPPGHAPYMQQQQQQQIVTNQQHQLAAPVVSSSSSSSSSALASASANAKSSNNLPYDDANDPSALHIVASPVGYPSQQQYGLVSVNPQGKVVQLDFACGAYLVDPTSSNFLYLCLFICGGTFVEVTRIDVDGSKLLAKGASMPGNPGRWWKIRLQVREPTVPIEKQERSLAQIEETNCPSFSIRYYKCFGKVSIPSRADPDPGYAAKQACEQKRCLHPTVNASNLHYEALSKCRRSIEPFASQTIKYMTPRQKSIMQAFHNPPESGFHFEEPRPIFAKRLQRV